MEYVLDLIVLEQVSGSNLASKIFPSVLLSGYQIFLGRADSFYFFVVFLTILDALS